MLQDSSPLIELPGIGPVKAAQLGQLGLTTIADLLDQAPRGYLDLSLASDTLDFSQARLYQGKLLKHSLRYLPRKRSVLTLQIICCQQTCRLVFFNMSYLQRQLQPQAVLHFHGRPEWYQNKIVFTQPRLLADGFATCLPLYPPIGNFSSGWIQARIDDALNRLETVNEDLPSTLLAIRGFPERISLWRSVHQAIQIGAAMQALSLFRQKLIYREFFLFHLQLATIRFHLKAKPRLHSYRMDADFKQLVKQRLPFKLTAGQKKILGEIHHDLSLPKTMQRLICGDVGSGKTIVAFIAILAALHSGHQGALLVPTEVLARQHFHKAMGFLAGYNIALLTGDTPSAQAKQIRHDLKNGTIRLIIGTHALLSSTTDFADLVLVVIDEQHRFGVSQRAALLAKSSSLDLLVTTATPIPRTLLLSHYSDLSSSTLRELPPGRKPIITCQLPFNERKAFYIGLRGRIQAGDKAFIVVPRISPDEDNPNLQCLETLYPKLCRLFGQPHIATLHGRMSPVEKETALGRFHSGQATILLATTVVEVGIDDADATLMIIENADRYGLAALHQLRGRVGRGLKQSMCYLLPSLESTPEGLDRVKALCETNDGFVIAQKDFAMRGGGLVAGSEQIGKPSFRHGDPFADRQLFNLARQDVAEHISLSDPPASLRPFICQIESQLDLISFS